jgi:hypothetical protein
LKRYAQMRGGSSEAELYARVFEPVFVRHVARWEKEERFDAEALCRDCDDALAEHLGERVEKLRLLLEILAHSPQTSIEQLLAQADAEEQASSSRTATSEIGRGGTRAADFAELSVAPKRLQAAHSPESVREALMDCVERCAQLTGVQNYVRLSEEAPLGYFMDVPASPLNPVQRRAWWLFVLLAGQLGRSNTESKIPSDRADEFAEPMTLDAAFLNWLLDGNDPAAATIWELLGLARTARTSLVSQGAPGGQ